MSREAGPGPMPDGQEQKFCEICLSTSHTADECDVKREGHMLEVQRWTESLLPALGVRAEKDTDEEGVTDYKLYDVESGQGLGELEILDEERALRVREIKTAGGWGSMLTFHFIAPDGGSLKLAGAPQPIEDIFNHGVSYLRGGDKPAPGVEAERVSREDERIAQDWGLTSEQWQFMKRVRNGLLHEAGMMSADKSRDFFNLIDRWQGRFSTTNERKETLYLSYSALEDKVFNQNMSPEEKVKFMERFGADLPEYKNVAALVARNELKKEAAKRGVPVEDWRIIRDTSRDIDALASTLDFNSNFLIHELSMGWRLRGPVDPKNQEREEKLLAVFNPGQRRRFDAIKAQAGRYHEIWNNIDTRERKS